jgi:DNA-binding NtrC family response regulator
MTKILVVDDDAAMREVLKIRLEKWGFEVRVVDDGREAQEAAESWEPDIILSDVVMPGLSGLDLLKSLKGKDRDRAVILVTAHGEVETAVEAMKRGAEDFITKPIDYGHLKVLLENAESRLQQRGKVERLRSRIAKGGDFGPFVGASRSMRQVYNMIEEAASTEAAVLVTGLSGTGKELVAKAIHDLSSRSSGPFFPLNSAAIPSELMESELFGHEKGAFTGAAGSRPGCFEQANRGTLFLDEIGEMPIQLQAKLLRVLEDGRVRRLGGREVLQVDVRLVAATNQDPRTAVERGKLREDLYFRLNVFGIELPALKDRTDDIPALVHHFICQFNDRHKMMIEGISDEVERLFATYLWPGNVRELRNVVERATVLAKSGWIEVAHLPPYLRQSGQTTASQIVLEAGTPLLEVEKHLILKTLELTGDNKAEAARRLGVDVKTIRNKLKSFQGS